jgi:signal transduction histidine kinase
MAQQATASALAESQTLAEAVPRVLGAVGTCFGWTWGVSWHADAASNVLRYGSSWHAPTTPLPELERLCRATVVTRGGAGLPGRVWASGQPGWIADLAADDDRELAQVARAAGLHSAFGFPVRVDDQVLAVLELFGSDVRLLDEGTIVLMAAIGAQLGHFIRRAEGALDRERLYEVEKHARREAEAQSQRLAFLANASALLTSAIDYERTLALLPRLAAATLADACVLDVADRHGERVQLAVTRDDLAAQELVPTLGLRSPVHPQDAPPTVGDAHQQPLFLEEADDAALVAALDHDEHVALARRVGTRSLVRIPLRTRGPAFGTLTLMRGPGTPRFAAADLVLAEELAWTASIAIEKARLKRETDDALRLRNRFLSIVSHDLKNPLQVIDLNAELLNELLTEDNASPVNVELARGLARIRRASTRMNAMIRELLDVARLQAGQPLDLDRRATDLVPLLHQVVEEFQHDWTDRTIELETTLARLVGELDAHRIERMIANLLSNAVKYSKPGGVVHVGLREEAGWAVIQVSDSGIGVPRALLADLFSAFRRSALPVGADAAHAAGAGVGLASAQQAAASHGGSITVDSVEGEGSTFTVRLPLAPPAP